MSTFMTSTNKINAWVMQHQSSVQIWSMFTLTLFLVILFISDRQFSFMLTFSSMISMMSLLMVFFKIEMAKSVQGVSMNMIISFLVFLSCRAASIIFWQGYLPYDATGDWMYQSVEVIQVTICGLILFRGMVTYKHTAADSEFDSLNPLYLICPAFVMGILIHPKLNLSFVGDFLWAFSMYLEAVSGLPQLVLFHKESAVKSFTSHFLFAQFVGKAASLLFWLFTHAELAEDASKFPGYWIIIMQGVQILIMVDFIYQYINCISRGVSVENIISPEREL